MHHSALTGRLDWSWVRRVTVRTFVASMFPKNDANSDEKFGGSIPKVSRTPLAPVVAAPCNGRGPAGPPDNNVTAAAHGLAGSLFSSP
jgi:hypothetical protein